MEESSPAQVTITDPNAAAPSALRLAIGTLPQGVVGGAYNGNFSATGGTSPYTWNIASGSFRPGSVWGPGMELSPVLPLARATTHSKLK